MKNFPWLEAAVFIALAIALIVKPHRSEQQQQPAQAATTSPYTLVLGQ